MRRTATTDQLRLHVIAGSHVVLLGIHLPEALCANLLGFAIHRTDHDEEEAGWLRGKKTFALTDPGFLPGATYSTRQHRSRASPGATSPPSPTIATPTAWSP